MAAQAQSPGRKGLKPRQDWFALSAEEALKGQPVELAGTVLCYDLGWGQFYVHDGVQAVYLNPRVFTNRFEVGQRVQIKGTTTWDGTVPILTNVTASVFGEQPLPPAPMLKLAELSKLHGQWIETRGQVRVAEASRERVTLILKDGDQECLVYVMQTSSTNQFKPLADSWVSIQGINASRIQGGRLEAAIVFSAGMNQVKVLTPGQSDRWQLPVTAIETLLSRPLGDWTNQPVHVNGLVSAYQPGSRISIKDPTGFLAAEVIQVTPVPLYQRVDAWGFLGIKTNQIVLTDAYFEMSKGLPGDGQVAAKPKRASTNEPPLTEISQIRLLKEKAKENLPARIHGVLTCVDLEWRVVFLQDDHDAIFLDTAQGDLKAGQWVEVTGQTDGSGFAPQLINCSTKILGMTNWPSPAKVDLQDAANGQLDSRWVEMEGVVRRVSKADGRISLVLASPSGKFAAIVRDFNNQPAPAALIDSLIRLRGACGSTLNSRGQLSGITLQVPSTNEIDVIDARPSNPFAIAQTPISGVATFNPERWAGRRVKVSGVVTLVAPGQNFFLQDASGGVRIQGSPTDQVLTGERLEVLGFPALLDFSPSLEEAAIRHLGTTNLPAAERTTAAQILQGGKHDGTMVELEGLVLQSLTTVAQPKLVLRDGPIIFTAQVAQSSPHKAMPELSPGSTVRVRGVCAIQGTENHEPATFRLLVADTKGIRLIKAAAWWTPRHTLLLVAGTTLGAFLALTWVLSLRRQVRAQTEIIRQNQEELLEISRRAGMAEIATSVLHNVGNVLNSVNISATIVADKIKDSGSTQLTRVVNLLDEHRENLGDFITQHPRGKHLPAFLKNLAARVREENGMLVKELDALCNNIGHIKEIVAMQQSFATVGGILESIKPDQIIEDALRIKANSLALAGIEVRREYHPQVGPLTVDKHKMLQILVNLISNAKEACSESQKLPKEITLRLEQSDGKVQVSVEDNGVGIAPENLTRIFSFGFTTRKNGHGFGLHGGALAAREIGGQLTVHSAGPGQGARFTLELPATCAAGPARSLRATG